MKYCIKCLQTDTRLNTIFTDEDLCPACNYHNNTRDIDWDDRFNILTNIISKIDKKPGRYFDCIVGVSGDKDSTRQALWVRDKLGLTPLLVGLMHPPEQVTERGVNNISNLIELGFDVVLSSLSPQMWKKTLYDGFFNIQIGQKQLSRQHQTSDAVFLNEEKKQFSMLLILMVVTSISEVVFI
jgi:hypothetical protein